MNKGLLLIVSVLFSLVPFCLGVYQTYTAISTFESDIGSPFYYETFNEFSQSTYQPLTLSSNGYGYSISQLDRVSISPYVYVCVFTNSPWIQVNSPNNKDYFGIDFTGSPNPVYAVGGNFFSTVSPCTFQGGIAITVTINPGAATQQVFTYTPTGISTFWGIYASFPITEMHVEGPSTDSSTYVTIENFIVGGANKAIANPDNYTFYANSVNNLITPLSNDVEISKFQTLSDLTLHISQPATGGNVTQNGNNYYFTPTPKFVGTVFFAYNLTDLNGLVFTSNITITVEGPKIPDYCYNLTTITVSKALKHSPQYFTFQDFGCNLSFWSITSVNATELYSFQSPNKIKLSIQPSMSGLRPVRYQVMATINNTQFVHNVVTQVNIVNHNPVAKSLVFTWTYPRTQQTFPNWNLLTNCTDQDGDNLTVVLIEKAKGRTAGSVVQLNDTEIYFVHQRVVLSVLPTGEISLRSPSDSDPVTAGSPLPLYWNNELSFQYKITDGDSKNQYAWGFARINSV